MWRASRPGGSCRWRRRSGSRLPAFHTAMGRVQLGFLDDSRDLAPAQVRPHRADARRSTITDLQALFDRIRDDHVQGSRSSTRSSSAGCARSPCRSSIVSRQAVAALNLSTHATRTTRNEMRDRFLPELRAAAAQIAAPYLRHLHLRTDARPDNAPAARLRRYAPRLYRLVRTSYNTFDNRTNVREGTDGKGANSKTARASETPDLPNPPKPLHARTTAKHSPAGPKPPAR